MRSPRLEIEARGSQAAQNALAEAGFAPKVAEGIIILHEPRAINAPEDIATLLVSVGAPPSRLAVEQETLEEHFLRLTGGKE